MRRAPYSDKFLMNMKSSSNVTHVDSNPLSGQPEYLCDEHNEYILRTPGFSALNHSNNLALQRLSSGCKFHTPSTNNDATQNGGNVSSCCMSRTQKGICEDYPSRFLPLSFSSEIVVEKNQHKFLPPHIPPHRMEFRPIQEDEEQEDKMPPPVPLLPDLNDDVYENNSAEFAIPPSLCHILSRIKYKPKSGGMQGLDPFDRDIL